MSAPKVGALFAGYGGLELAVRDVFPAASPAWVAEFDAAPSRVLAQRFPDAPNLGDVTAVDWAAVEPVDVITGGSPCQDLSHAGKRAGMKPGTRSGLWASMCDAIEIIRPRFVIWENVRGALSACASSETDRDLGPCPRCLDSDSGAGHAPNLRALGRVLGDLAELGFDAAWTTVRASDAGAPHQRERVFVLAWDASAGADPGWLDGRASTDGGGAVADRLTLLPSPRTSDTNGAGAHGDGGLDLRTAVAFLPTPRAARGGSATETVALLPTPAAQEPGGTAERYHARLAAHDGRESSFLPLSMAVQQLLPTPTATDRKASGATYAATSTHHAGTALTDATVRNPEINPDRSTRGDTTKGRPGEVLPDVRSSDGAEEVCERATRGPGRVPPQGSLFAGLREHEGGRLEGHTPLAGEEASSGLVPGVRDGESPARAPHRPESGEQRPVEPADAVRVMPSAPPLAGGPGQAACGCAAWATYAPAIHRWEHALGRLAPQPTEPTGKNGAHRLSARAVEFMMGLPDGWVTDTDTTRNEQLKALGNGVVPQQAAAAVRHLLTVRAAALAGLEAVA